MTTFNSVPRLIHSTPVVSKVADRVTQFLARWLDKREGIIMKNRFVGEISGIPWCEPANAVDRDFVDAWKHAIGGHPANLLAGMSGWRDLWRHRGLFTFTLRIGNWEYMWESSQKMAAGERRRARSKARREKAAAELEAEVVAEELRAASREHREQSGTDVV